MANARTKIEYLDGIKTEKDYFRLARNVRCIAFDVASGRAYQYINLRQVLSRKMNQEKISRRQMAKAIGICQSSFTDYLSGRRGLPYKYMERVLGILYGDSDWVDKMTKEKAAQ